MRVTVVTFVLKQTKGTVEAKSNYDFNYFSLLVCDSVNRDYLPAYQIINYENDVNNMVQYSNNTCRFSVYFE